MADDLVKRLHKWVDDLEHDCDYDLEFELSGEEAGNFANDICGMLTRIEKLEAALRDCVNFLACFERPNFYQLERTSPIKPYALGALDVARKALDAE